MNEDEVVNRYVAEIVKRSLGEDVAAVSRSEEGTGAIVLTENGRAYRVSSIVTIERLS